MTRSLSLSSVSSKKLESDTTTGNSLSFMFFIVKMSNWSSSSRSVCIASSAFNLFYSFLDTLSRLAAAIFTLLDTSHLNFPSTRFSISFFGFPIPASFGFLSPNPLFYKLNKSKLKVYEFFTNSFPVSKF